MSPKKSNEKQIAMPMPTNLMKRDNYNIVGILRFNIMFVNIRWIQYFRDCHGENLRIYEARDAMAEELKLFKVCIGLNVN